VRVGTLKNVGTASALGTGVNGSIGIVGGTLAYAGAGDSSDRDFVLQGNAGLVNDGTGALALGGGVAFSASGTNTLTLGGSFSGINTVS
ncbi:hypothetical protein AB4144_64640, partial [Rhizobiaceae sp. 2RAB30]